MAHYRVVVSGALYSNLWQNVLHFNAPDGVPNRSAAAVLIRDHWVEAIRGPLNRDINFGRVEVYDDENQLLAPFTVTFSKTGAGGGTDQLMLPMAYVMQKKTGLTGRKNRGRLYIPGVNGGHFSNGVLMAAGAAAWLPSLNTLKSDWIAPATQGLQLEVKHHGSEHDYTLCNDLVIRNTAGVQRRRNSGVGV